MDMFHMADFEARGKAQNFLCSTWDEPKRRELLNNLLDIIGRHSIEYFGFTNLISDAKNQREDGYSADVLDAIYHISGVASTLGDSEIALVFAKEPQFGFDKINAALGSGLIDQSQKRTAAAIRAA